MSHIFSVSGEERGQAERVGIFFDSRKVLTEKEKNLFYTVDNFG